MLFTGCTGSTAVETVACSSFELQREGKKERGRKRGRRGARDGAASSVQMGIWSWGYTHMYACERQIEESEGEKGKCNSRLHVLVLQRGWACVGGGEGTKRAEMERERR